jgi:pilus assembly protein Flp/PilA
MDKYTHKLLKRFYGEKDGVTAIEYGLIATFIAIIAVTAMALVGTNLTAEFNIVAAKF